MSASGTPPSAWFSLRSQARAVVSSEPTIASSERNSRTNSAASCQGLEPGSQQALAVGEARERRGAHPDDRGEVGLRDGEEARRTHGGARQDHGWVRRGAGTGGTGAHFSGNYTPKLFQ